MDSESSPNSNNQYPLPPTLSNETQGILDALGSQSSLINTDHLSSENDLPELNMEMLSNVNSSLLEAFPNLRSSIGDNVDSGLGNLIIPSSAYMQNLENTNMGNFMSTPSAPMPYLSNNAMNLFLVDDNLYQLYQGIQRERLQQQLDSVASYTGLNESALQNLHGSFPIQLKPEALNPILMRSTLNVNQENNTEQQNQMIQEAVFNDYNPQLMGMLEQLRVPTQLQPPVMNSAPQAWRSQPLVGNQLPKMQMTSIFQDQSDQQGTLSPLLDGDICSQKFMKYLLCFRNHIRENNISSWRKFVTEFYAPGAKKRWCFSNYKNAEHEVNGVLCPKPTEKWSCDLCGAKSGKGLEVTANAFPRVFKAKFELGVRDEILFLDLPRPLKVSSGLMLEYGRVIQESVYDGLRVVHEGKLRVGFRNDLKIVSWEFCAKHHELYIHREVVAPQVKQIVKSANKCLQDIPNGLPYRMSTRETQENYRMLDSATKELAQSIEFPLVNALGYPRQFIRCLQMAEVVNSMTDIITLTRDTQMGPIECLKYTSQLNTKRAMEVYMGCSKNPPAFSEKVAPRHNPSGYRTKPGGSGTLESALANLKRRPLGERYDISSLKRKRPDQSCFMDPSSQAEAASLRQSINPLGQSLPSPYSFPRSQPTNFSKALPNQSLFDKLLFEMNLANMEKNQRLQCGESSKTTPVEANSADTSKAVANIPRAENRSLAIKEELPPSPLPGVQEHSATRSGKGEAFKE
ncbi:probable transcriptional regulator SLK2 [Andrographis paniculata]|uniref:probable transcriptional regulator SLK2 n=1 Tax=Andrographis paniculata TaxID=175694 RepID=UPI0021E74919|nr:probable transcriptional regulator SLK2 [Andrographis paniculata]